MPLSPLCLVDNGTAFVSTANGVDVSPGATVSIKLDQPSGVVTWLLQVIGTDELNVTPTLTEVNDLTHEVQAPSTVVTFTFPATAGSAVGFRSEVRGVGGPVSTTFGIYSPTSFNTRVGFVAETREGNSSYGWASKINPLIRSGGGAGGGFGWKTIPSSQTITIPQYQEMMVSDPITVDGVLEIAGDVLILDVSGGGGAGPAGPPGITVVDAPYDKHMPAITTTGAGRELACATGLSVTPHLTGALYISVNGIWVTDIGYGSTSNCSCYWSNDGGLTAKTRPNVAMGDRLYWNGDMAEFDLSAPQDFIDFWYDIALT